MSRERDTVVLYILGFAVLAAVDFRISFGAALIAAAILREIDAKTEDSK